MRRGSKGFRGIAPFWANTLARLGLLFAGLALLSQSLVLSAPMPGAGRLADARAAQAQLAALFGPDVVLCASSNDSDAPADCHETCPLCRLAADLAGLDAPAPPAFATPLPAAELALFTPAPADPPARAPSFHPLPRGPPSKA